MRLVAAERSTQPAFLSDPQIVQRLLDGNDQYPAFNVNHLRANDTLQKEEWLLFDEAVMRVKERRRGFLGLLTRRPELRFDLPNALGVMILQWNTESDMDPATRAMDPTVHGDRDRLDYALASMPVYTTFKDFGLDIRTLAASRKLGQPLDTRHAEVATRLVLESLNEGFVAGPGITAGGSTAPGLMTQGSRNTTSFESSDPWDDAAKTGEDILTDVNAMRTIAKADRHFGPYAIVIPNTYETVLDEDFKANSDKTTRQRILELNDIDEIVVDDFLPDGNVLLVEMSPDVVELVDGEAPTLVSWMPSWGRESFKVLAIQALRMRVDAGGRSGIVHMS